jgi:DNA-binding MarR family transcriptional regulator
MENILVSMETTVRRLPRQRRTAAPELESHLGYWLRRVSNHVSGAFARALQIRHTSVAEWVVMCQVQKHRGITPAELAESLDLTRGAVSKVIDKLEAKKWVVHSTKPEDGRVQLLSLTRQGSRILPELAEIADRNDRGFFEGLDSDEKTTLRRLLGKLVEFHQIRNVPIE